MNVSAVSGISSWLASEVSALKGGEVAQAIQTAVLKQTLDQTRAAGEALVRMIEAAPTANEFGGRIDIRA